MAVLEVVVLILVLVILSGGLWYAKHASFEANVQACKDSDNNQTIMNQASLLNATSYDAGCKTQFWTQDNRDIVTSNLEICKPTYYDMPNFTTISNQCNAVWENYPAPNPATPAPA